MAPPDYRIMWPKWRPAIPLGTTDLWCDDALLVAKMFLRLEPESQEAIHLMSALLTAINGKTERK